MKKSISILTVAALATSMFVACGPSKAAIEAKEKAKQDSLAQIRIADSVATVAAATAAAAKMQADSLAQVAKADSAKLAEAAAPKGKKGGKK